MLYEVITVVRIELVREARGKHDAEGGVGHDVQVAVPRPHDDFVQPQKKDLA